MSLVAAQNSSHCNGVWESRRFLAVLLKQNVDTRHHVSHLSNIPFSSLHCVLFLCEMYRWSHGNTWPIFKRCVPWCWTRGVLSQPQGKIAWFMRYQEGFRYKVQCEGRPRVNLFSWWVYHYQVYINIITQSGAACWSVPEPRSSLDKSCVIIRAIVL